MEIVAVNVLDSRFRGNDGFEHENSLDPRTTIEARRCNVFQILGLFGQPNRRFFRKLAADADSVQSGMLATEGKVRDPSKITPLAAKCCGITARFGGLLAFCRAAMGGYGILFAVGKMEQWIRLRTFRWLFLAAVGKGEAVKANRLGKGPIIVPEMDERMGSNINGPSLVLMPEWGRRLGKYHLYFAHHQGAYIRLAYADDLLGPWSIHTPGVLELDKSHFNGHIASPDMHIKEERREIWMYYHGADRPNPLGQRMRVAVSTDGLRFEAREEWHPGVYWRVFRWGGWHYALGIPGTMYRSKDALTDWVEGPQVFPLLPDREIGGKVSKCGYRHGAVLLRGDVLHVFYSNRGDCPERILHSTLRLSEPWEQWRVGEPDEVLSPEMDYEGANAPHVPSRGGAVHEPAWQLRDPAVYEEGGQVYLLYSVAGERGIAIARLDGV